MASIEIRSVIKYLFLKGKTPSEIHNKLSDVIERQCPSYSAVKFRVRKVKCGHLDVTNEPRSGRPQNVITEINVAKIKELVLSDRRMTIKELVNETSLSYGTVWTILHEHLNMTKVSARWVPRLLTEEMKAERKR